MEEVKKAICPYCGTKMVSIFYECEDDSGANLFWGCNCSDVLNLEMEVIREMRDEVS